MENITDIQSLFLVGIGIAITLLVKFVLSKGALILERIKESETKLDDKLVLALIDAALEQGIISDKAHKKVKDELSE